MQEGLGYHVPAGFAWGRVGSMQRLLLVPVGGQSGGFSKGHSKSWSLQTGASACVPKKGCFWL